MIRHNQSDPLSFYRLREKLLEELFPVFFDELVLKNAELKKHSFKFRHDSPGSRWIYIDSKRNFYICLPAGRRPSTKAMSKEDVEAILKADSLVHMRTSP